MTIPTALEPIVSAAGVAASTAPVHGAGAGSSPSAALQELRVGPIPVNIAKHIVRSHHYLHSLPGGTCLAFGVLAAGSLLGVVTLGVGSTNAHRLVDGAKREDCLALTRLWLSDQLPSNSESRVLGIVIRSLRRHTSLKFLVTYADPSQGHVGVIYQATGWLYTGLSQPTPLYDIGDGRASHSRSFSQAYGTRSARYFAGEGMKIKKVPVTAKHRYVLFLDLEWKSRLRVPVLAYPKKDTAA